jgi:uncharacterized protein
MDRHIAPPKEWDCRIPLSDIKRNGAPYREVAALPISGAVEYWGQLYSPDGPLSASLTANYAGENIVVRVELEGDFTLPCSRCLEETGLAIKGDMRYLFTLRSTAVEEKRRGRRNEADDEDESDGDVDVIEIDPYHVVLDLAPYVWETMILSLPERVLCGDDCLGLCPICGLDRNIRDCGCAVNDTDPRFAVLRDLETLD